MLSRSLRIIRGSKSKRFVSKLYQTHQPTSIFQKGLLTIGSSLIALYNPERADMVAALGETTGCIALEKMLKRMKACPEGQQILVDRPRVNEVLHPEIWSTQRLSNLPKNTLGYAYHRYMSVNGFLGSERPVVKFVDHEEKAYVMTRYREIHDFYHVLADLPPTILGEIIVKWIEFFQTGLPMNVLGGVFGPLKLSSEDKRILRESVPWIRSVAKNSNDIMCIYFEKHLEEDLEEFRQRVNFPICPIK